MLRANVSDSLAFSDSKVQKRMPTKIVGVQRLLTQIMQYIQSDLSCLFLAYPPGDYSEPLGKNPSITTASPCG